jgi:UDP-N-acetylmuramate--alanine ligase
MVGLLDIYAAREQDDLGISSDDIAELIPEGALRSSTPSEAAGQLASLVRSGDVVLTLGAGDITQTGPHLLALLERGGA